MKTGCPTSRISTLRRRYGPAIFSRITWSSRRSAQELSPAFTCARDLQLDRPVALKVFKPDCPVTPSTALAEARAAAALNHPNVCTIYAVDDTAGVPIIAMEYVPGQPLSNSPRDRIANYR